MCSATGVHHAICSGRTANMAAIYPCRMCKAILQGLKRYLEKNHRTRDGMNAVLPPTEQEPESNLDCEWLLLSSGDFYDTTTGQVLKKQLVQEAGVTEMGWLDSKNVWTKVPVREAYDKTGKGPISAKWVDTIIPTRATTRSQIIVAGL